MSLFKQSRLEISQDKGKEVKELIELSSTARYKSSEVSKTLSSYRLSLMGVSRLTLINKTLLDAACDTLDPNLFHIKLYSYTNFVTSKSTPRRREHP